MVSEIDRCQKPYTHFSPSRIVCPQSWSETRQMVEAKDLEVEYRVTNAIYITKELVRLPSVI